MSELQHPSCNGAVDDPAGRCPYEAGYECDQSYMGEVCVGFGPKTPDNPSGGIRETRKKYCDNTMCDEHSNQDPDCADCEAAGPADQCEFCTDIEKHFPKGDVCSQCIARAREAWKQEQETDPVDPNQLTFDQVDP